MAELVRYTGQVTVVDGSAAAINDNSAVTAAGITNTGNITTTGTAEAVGGVIITADDGSRVLATLEDLGGDVFTWVLTKL